MGPSSQRSRVGEGVKASTWRLDGKQEASQDFQLLNPPGEEMLGSLLAFSWAVVNLSLAHPSGFLLPITPDVANLTGFLEHRVPWVGYILCALLACLSY